MKDFYTILIISALIIGYGILGIRNKKITIKSRISPAEIHQGRSAVIWGGIFICFGLFLLLSFILINMNFFVTGKLDWGRLF